MTGTRAPATVRMDPTATLAVACVYRSGGSYFPRYVRALRDAVARHLRVPHRFVCLTDDERVPCERVPLIHDWPRFYAKIELFRPGLFEGPVLYLDLDTLVVGDIGDFARVAAERDFTAASDPWLGIFNSSIMGWSIDCSFVYHRFRRFPAWWQHRFRHEGRRYGDQGFTEETLRLRGVAHGVFDQLLPGQIASYRHCAVGGPPPDARICTMMTRPKPHETDDWVPEHWR